jgi:hypothetical protein
MEGTMSFYVCEDPSAIFLTTLPERKRYLVFTQYTTSLEYIPLEKDFSPLLFRFDMLTRLLESRQEILVDYCSLATTI